MIIPTDELIFLRGFDTTRKIDLKMWSQVAKVISLFQCSLISHFGSFSEPILSFRRLLVVRADSSSRVGTGAASITSMGSADCPLVQLQDVEDFRV